MLFQCNIYALCSNESLGNTIYFTLKEKELHCCCLTFYGNMVTFCFQDSLVFDFI